MDRADELVGLEHPAFDHILDLSAGESKILGRLHHGELLAVFVFHPTLTSLPGKDRVETPDKDTPARPLFSLIQLSAWKGYSANFALTEFWEVRGWE